MKDKITTNITKEINQDKYKNVEVFQVKNLLVNITKHHLQPKFDIILPNDKIKRVTFGIYEIWGTKHVACISEILRFKAEPKYENGYDNYIDHMLDLAYWENGYD